MMGQLIGCGALMITIGVFGLIISYFGITEGSSRRAVWRVFGIFGELVGSTPIASGIFIAFGIALILVAFGYEAYKKEERKAR